MTTRILRTVFLTSAFAYIGFAYLDYLEPGVVSDVMSVYLWLVPIVISGIFWARASATTSSPHHSSIITFASAVLIGLALGGIVWHNGDMFGDFRLLLALGAVALPAAALSSLYNHRA